jgi:hypothetical protein
MSYTAWSVVFGEQPTAAKWNQLGQNDAGFKDGTNIDDDAIIARHISGFDKSNLTVDSNPYKFLARGSGTQSVGSNASATVIFNTEEVDTNNNYNPATGIYTAPIDGLYQINANARNDTSTSAFSQLLLFKNGSQFTKFVSMTAGAGQQTMAGAALVNLTAGDTIEVKIYNSAGTGTIQRGDASFSGFLVCRT